MRQRNHEMTRRRLRFLVIHEPDGGDPELVAAFLNKGSAWAWMTWLAQERPAIRRLELRLNRPDGRLLGTAGWGPGVVFKG